MIGLDTNVLLRLLTRDDPEQARLADALIEKREPILLCDLVIAELVWTLKRKFDWTKADIVGALDRLLGQSAFVFNDRSVVMSATRSYEHGKADFADYLIGARNHVTGETSTYTFDRDAGHHRWFTLISPDG